MKKKRLTVKKLRPLIESLIRVTDSLVDEPVQKRLEHLKLWSEVAKIMLEGRTDYEVPTLDMLAK
jgi:hypothetical protein